jgi:formate C-acetyltransferase
VDVLVNVLRKTRERGSSLAETFPRLEILLDAVKQEMRRNAERSAAVARTVGHVHREYGQIPFTSAFMHGCVERARDLTVRAEYNFPSMNLGCGFPNFVNSVAAIRHLVYRERMCTLDALFDAMAADFEGAEGLRAAAARAPKFGNDDDEADDLIPVLEQMHAEAIAGLKGPRNEGRFITTGVDGGGHITQGRALMATPDGRRGGAPLAPGMGAAQGTDRRGLTALLNSVQRLDSQGHWFGGYTVNLRVMPEVLESKTARTKLMAALRTYFMGRGLNLHMNCVSSEMLRSAQRSPENYRDLIVRVSGFNDYFVMLSPEVQAEIINRTEQRVEQ